MCVRPQELEAIPMFMKRCPAEIDAARQPELACLQSLLFDEEQGPAGGQPGMGMGGLQ